MGKEKSFPALSLSQAEIIIGELDLLETFDLPEDAAAAVGRIREQAENPAGVLAHLFVLHKQDEEPPPRNIFQALA